LHKRVSVRATATTVKIYSLDGQFICEWPRATSKGQWQTDPKHLPANYSEYAEWNSTNFISKAMTVGPNTTAVIKEVLKSRKIEVQTYRMCTGILNFAKKYNKSILEQCCKEAIALGKPTYTFVKNSIPAIADECSDKTTETSKLNEERNRGAFVMTSSVMDVDNLLSRSESLAKHAGKERKHEES
jgi:hypothetical protein